MKFVRKLTVLIITVIFIAAFAIGIGVVFSVKNVNVTLLSYEYGECSEEANRQIAEVKQKILDYCRGNVIAFVDEVEVINCVDGNVYTVESCEKVLPCTINLTIKQRTEVFVQSRGEYYAIFDENGQVLRGSENIFNSFDKAPNVIVDGAHSDEDIKIVADVCSVFKARFGSLRSVIDSVELVKAQTALTDDKFIFNFRCGIKIELQDYSVYTAEKIDEALIEFSSLTGEQKIKGTIYCFEDLDGIVRRTYNPEI